MNSRILYSLGSLRKLLEGSNPSRVFVVTSQKLEKKLQWAIKEIGVSSQNIILIPDGEKAKSWKELEKLLKKFSRIGVDRNSVIVALGGGTVGDIVGFAASIYLRGIKYFQVPTTLLAQVDSAHGSKTGINFLEYKNQIGSLYTPVATVIDHRFARSLSEEQIIDGLGEIIKAGLIKDASILSILKKHSTVAAVAKGKDLPKIIRKSVKVKQYFVGKNFAGGGLREILNVGHTLGHAIELKYKISHGLAVIIGTLQELEVSEKLGLTPIVVRKNLEALLANLGIKINKNMKAEWKTILHDKKIIGDKIIFPFVKKEGVAGLARISLKVFKKAL